MAKKEIKKITAKSEKPKAKSKAEIKTIAKKVEVKKEVIAKSLKPKAKSKIEEKTISKKINVKKDPAEFGIWNIVAIIAVIVVFAIAGFLIDRYNQKVAPAPKEVQATQSINYDCVEGKTALALLKDKAEIKTVDSSFGAYVDEINGAANNNGSFWIFYVNSKMAEVGPDQYNCQPNDKVEWRYEKIM